ncbi:MAG: DNA-directed RNA polymerase subunit N [Aigarchaeota archaeon]|nr:DNA-directed RNA polymerase subunit N [Aigarchaeota archaeon]MDW8092274.1 DNA-directed RNA polymerase subunit N [Nitrososphaerota archaeon]
MMFPIRCFSCGSPIGDKWDEYKSMIDSGTEPSKALDKLGITRYCCRRMFISHVDVMEDLVKFHSLYGTGV